MAVQAAVEAVDITPEGAVTLQGWDVPRTTRDVHLALKAKVLVMDDGRRQAGLVTLDLLGLESPWVARVRRQLERKTGIPSARWMISCSHTHSGPSVTTLQFPGAREPNILYLRRVVSAVGEAGKRAWGRLEPIRVGWGRGQVTFPVNRRRVVGGRVAQPPMANPDGPVDREVGVLRIDRPDGRPVAVLMNCACHPSIWGRGAVVSPDYPGVAQKLVEEDLDDGVVAQFLLGCCGDVRANFTRASGHFDHEGRVENVEAAGRELAEEVLRVWERIVPRPVEEVQVASTHRLLPFAEDLPAPAPALEAEFQGLRAGDLLILSFPGEVFAEFGLEVKRRLSQPPLIATCTDGYLGYIPTADAYPLGGYEVERSWQWWGYPGPLHPVTGSLFVDEALKVASELQVPLKETASPPEGR